MDEIIPAIRNLFLDHLANSQPLTADVAIGDTVLKVPNTSRFRVGDQISFVSTIINKGEFQVIKDIPDDKTLIIAPGAAMAWTVLNGTNVIKSVNNEFLKGVYIGDLHMIPSFPAITIDADNEKPEWFTLRQTSHEYRMKIRIYELADNFEKTNLRLLKIAKQAREILLDHIRPIINGVSYPLTADLPAGQTVVNVSDTSQFKVGGPVFLRDAHPRPAQQESYVKSILSPVALELNIAAENDYLMSREAELILVQRLLYDTMPDDINYGVINKGGTFCRAAEFSYFAKEMLVREGNILT